MVNMARSKADSFFPGGSVSNLRFDGKLWFAADKLGDEMALAVAAPCEKIIC